MDTSNCTLLSRLFPQLIENVLKIAVDPIFPPPCWPKSKRHMVPDNVYESNRFELIFDELEDQENLAKLVISQELTDSKMKLINLN
jgi:tubulin polyglutamylase TTLL1